MDWLRLVVAAMGVLYIISAAAAPLRIGKPREPITGTDAGCGVLVSLVMLVVTLLLWQRLGGG